ncbi:conserved hypothetical protein [Gammaproteobacteria bacterium]
MKFIKEIFSSENKGSAKRVFGAFGWLFALYMIYSKIPSLTETVLYISAALLGLETIINIIKGFNVPKEEKPKE